MTSTSYIKRPSNRSTTHRVFMGNETTPQTISFPAKFTDVAFVNIYRLVTKSIRGTIVSSGKIQDSSQARIHRNQQIYDFNMQSMIASSLHFVYVRALFQLAYQTFLLMVSPVIITLEVFFTENNLIEVHRIFLFHVRAIHR